MNPSQRISNLVALGDRLADLSTDYWQATMAQAKAKNGWFTIDNITQSLTAIRDEYLHPEKLSAWTAQYDLSAVSPQKIAIIMAGNIPLVGIHDLICSYAAGHHTIIKYSSKDEVLIKAIVQLLSEIDKDEVSPISIVSQLKDYDAVIATGGDTAAVHFEYYFAKYPHIIRKNRNSIAVLTGQESEEELRGLADDIFGYFGLGCRSVSKVYIPQDFDTDRLFEAFTEHHDLIHHNKYKNNFDYNHAIYALTVQPFLTNDVVILREDQSIASRIACLHYERYTDMDELLTQLEPIREELQCLSSQKPLAGWPHIPLGHCQKPGLTDYADHVDTMKFLTTL